LHVVTFHDSFVKQVDCSCALLLSRAFLGMRGAGLLLADDFSNNPFGQAPGKDNLP
jgi:hypothetical protein